MQVVRTGSGAQIAEAATTLKNTRRALYRILAEDTPPGQGDTPGRRGPRLIAPPSPLPRRVPWRRANDNVRATPPPRRLTSPYAGEYIGAML